MRNQCAKLRRYSCHKRQQGTAALEFALIAPLFLFILILSLAFALAFYIQTVMQGAAEEGVQYVLQIDRSAFDLSAVGAVSSQAPFVVTSADRNKTCASTDFSDLVECQVKKGVATGLTPAPSQVFKYTQVSYSVKGATGSCDGSGAAADCRIQVSLSFNFNSPGGGAALMPTKWWFDNPLIQKLKAQASSSFW